MTLLLPVVSLRVTGPESSTLSFRRLAAVVVVAGALVLPSRADAEPLQPLRRSHAIAMHGAPALPADFKALPYVKPDAPKGGRFIQGFVGTFDSLNPMIVRGI